MVEARSNSRESPALSTGGLPALALVKMEAFLVELSAFPTAGPPTSLH
jgi:hypothetical protein